MRHLFYHAAEPGCIRPLDHLIDFAQPQAPHHLLMLFGGTDRAAHELDLDLGFHYIFSTARPRISATAFLSRNCSRAAMVALTTLCGLCEPIDFVNTLGMPTAWITARTGPPAIT